MPQRWTSERANEWYVNQPWLVGCNFIPSTAINQLEMWQSDTFDPHTIDRELGWAADLGFNAMRVFLHDLAWKADPAGFKSRIDHYLDIAAGHRIRTTFVFLDDCWNPNPQIGRQPSPKPGVHNSGWVQSPGMDVIKNPKEWSRLEDYISDIVSTYASDERVVIWDVYNEPGNYFLTSMWLPPFRRVLRQLALLIPHTLLPVPSLPLLHRAVSWARAAHPTQPLTVGLWFLRPGIHSRLNKTMIELSDVISFHDYHRPAQTEKLIRELKPRGRPLFCTEYMARTHGSLFVSHLPIFERERIGAFSWGLVAGKTQTYYTWEDQAGPGEPQVWFHDILRANGTPYDADEVAFIRRILKE
jgi:hypothetical protein